MANFPEDRKILQITSALGWLARYRQDGEDCYSLPVICFALVEHKEDKGYGSCKTVQTILPLVSLDSAIVFADTIENYLGCILSNLQAKQWSL